MRILKRVPRSVLWLLRFPREGEVNLKRAAEECGVDSARIVFSDLAAKD